MRGYPMAPAKAAATAQFDFDDAKSFDDNLSAFFDSLEADDAELAAVLRAKFSAPRQDNDDWKDDIWDGLLAALAEASKS
jgi:hypothetical protein